MPGQERKRLVAVSEQRTSSCPCDVKHARGPERPVLTNSVLANALLRSIDILRPRVLATRPSRIEFVVGSQINGAPHLGTNLVQAAAFLLAKTARREFSIDTVVRFGALDNAPTR